MKTAIDLFAGGGGASIGLKQAGFGLIAAVEFDPQIAEVHHKNHPQTTTIVGDVKLVDFAKFSGIDHVHGSPPCQSFSIAASKEAKDKRIANGEQDLIFEWVRAIAQTRPRTASLENVPPTVNSPLFRKTCQKLFELGYWLNWEVYNAADFGVPQTRKRLFLRAIRDNVLGTMPIERADQTLFGEKYWWGMTPKKQQWVSWYEAIADLIPSLPETEPAPWQLKKLPKELESFLITGENASHSKICRSWCCPAFTVTTKIGTIRAFLIPGQNDTNPVISKLPDFTITGKPSGTKAFLVPRVGARTRELAARSQEKPAPTIRALGHDGHWRQLDAWLSFGEFRQITPRALARFQSFPDDFLLPDNNALAGKIVGNAVPPNLIKSLVETFAD